MKEDQPYEIIIVGGSYAGLAAGMTLGRALRRVLIIDSGMPSNRQTPYSHNFLTNDGYPPADIAARALQQVKNYRTVDFEKAQATSASLVKGGFEIRTAEGNLHRARKLVLATGIKDLLPAIPGFEDCWGISALHCPYCHGYEARGLETGILANGDLAVELSSLVLNWTKDLTVYTEGPSLLTDHQQKKMEQHGIHIEQRKISRIQHVNGLMEKIVFEDGGERTIKALYSRAPFVQHSEIAGALGCEFTPEGHVKVDSMQRTSVAGVYACGDNSSRMRTVANAVSSGTTTAMVLNRDLIDEDF